MAQEQPEQDDGGQGGRTPVLEWISAAAGLILTLAMLSFIGWQAFAGASTEPPVLEVRTERIVPAANGWVVEITAENLSATTAAGVQIEGVLLKDGRTVAMSRATLDYVPGSSERQGGLFFKEDPQAHDLELRALGYARP